MVPPVAVINVGIVDEVLNVVDSIDLQPTVAST